MPPEPFQPADDTARALARRLIATADHAALAVLQPGTGRPSVTRIALAAGPGGAPLTLISQLSTHTAALQANPACSMLLAEPQQKGDPLTHPRLTLHCTARFIERGSRDHADIRAQFLAQRPKSKLYADFPDFHFVRFAVSDGLLNGGFGKAYLLQADDLV